MRIAARTLLCANAFRVHVDISGGLFEELRQLCAAAGDKASLAIGMAGLVEVHMIYGRVGEASRLASETMALVESIGNPTLTVGLSMFSIAAKLHTGEIAEALRWSQTVIDLADGEPAKAANGNSIIDWPLTVALAHALATRGTARCALGHRGWRSDLDQAVAMARSIGPLAYGVVISYSYGLAISSGVLLADDAALRDIEEALRSPSDRVRISRWALPGSRWASRWCIGTPRQSVSADWSCWGRSATCACTGGSTCPCLRSSTCAPHGSGPGAVTATVPYRYCVKSSTTCSMPDSSGLALGRPPFWWRRCWSVVPGMTWPKPRPRSTGWRPHQPTTGLVIREVWLLRLRALLARAHGDDTGYSGSLPRDGGIVGLRGTYRVGRGDAMMAGIEGGGSRCLEIDE